VLIQLGDRGPSVTKLQRELLVTVTGIYDAATQSAVSAYQTSAGLTATGIVDLTTWWTLFPDDAAIVAGVEVAGTFSSGSTAKIPTTKAVADYVAAHGGGGATPGLYGSFYDTTNQYAAAINTGYPITLNTTVENNGVSIVSGSRITVTSGGVFNIQFSAQLVNADTSVREVTMWIKLNGVNVPYSAGAVSVPNSHGGTHGQIIAAWNYVMTLAAGDYIQFYWQTPSTQVHIELVPDGAAPVSPSMIVTVQQVASTVAGPTGPAGTSLLYGSTAPSSSTGNNGDFYINTTNNYLYGPKASGAWPSGTPLTAGTGPAGGDLTGTYPNPTLAAVATAATLGSATKSLTVTIDAKGRVTSMTENTITATDSTKLPLAGGTMTGSLVLRTGSASAGTAPAKLVSGTLMTAPEAGAVEFNTDNAYLTITTGTARKALVLADGTLISGRVPFLTTNGRVADSANLTYSDAAATMTVSLSQNAQTGMQITNANAGGNAIAGIKCTSNASNCTIGASSSASTYAGAMVFYTPDAVAITFYNNGLRRATINSDGNLGVGVTNGTATLHLKAGSATSGTAPLKINSGTVMGTPETGAVEYDGTDWYLTNSTPARRTVAYLATVTSSSTPVTVPAIGGHVRVVGAAGAKTVTLPATSGVKAGTRVTIKDAAGNAASGTITVNAASTETIDGAASATITTNYGVLRLIYSGSTGRWETC